MFQDLIKGLKLYFMIGDIIGRIVRYEWLLGEEGQFMQEAIDRNDWEGVNKSAAMIRELEEKKAVACKKVQELALLN